MGLKDHVINDIPHPKYSGETAQVSSNKGTNYCILWVIDYEKNDRRIPTPPFFLKYLDQCCPIEIECKPQMWPTHVILHFVVTTLKSKRKHEINFNILTQYIQHIIISTCNQYKHNNEMLNIFFLLSTWDPAWILHCLCISIWTCCISRTLQPHMAGGYPQCPHRYGCMWVVASPQSNISLARGNSSLIQFKSWLHSWSLPL